MKSIQVYEGDGVPLADVQPWIANFIEKQGESMTVDGVTSPAELSLKTTVDNTLAASGLPTVTDIEIKAMFSAENSPLIRILEEYKRKSMLPGRPGDYKFSAIVVKGSRKIKLDGCFVTGTSTMAAIDGTFMTQFSLHADQAHDC